MIPVDPPSTTSRLAVVGTAGHIDHGKTAMVRRLTGVDTDRLPEEKQRGISIDLGFAPLVTPSGIRVGLVDVPGHERFVKNMLAGVGGIDLVLLVIAADEGVMPQTREHLAIVKLLGVRRGVVVLTKCDLVEREWLEAVKGEVGELLAGTALADAPIIPFSAVTGAGESELLAAMDRQLADLANRSVDEPARLPIDRVFTVEGFGTVVTGTLWRGQIRTGDALVILPRERAVRVRRVQVHGASVEEARAGQRTAVALHGVERDQLERGDWLLSPNSLRSSSILDVRFELLPDVPREWPTNSRVRFHLGASEIIGRLVLLEGSALKPGATVLAQLRLEQPTVAARGDRFVIRSYSPSRTVGGGTVIESVAAKRRRAAELESLSVHETGSVESRLIQCLDQESRPTSAALLAQALSEKEAGLLPVLDALASEGKIVALPTGRWFSAKHWQAARDAIGRTVREYADRYPARFGISKGDLKSGLKSSLEASLFDAAFDSLIKDDLLELRAERVRPAGNPWQPPAALMKALDSLEAQLEATGLGVPEVASWQAAIGPTAGELLSLGIFLGRLARVSQELTYTSRQLESLRAKLVAHFGRRPVLSVAEFKELAGVSRKYAVPLLEHCDRVGWTVRSGDERKAGAKLSAVTPMRS